MEDGSDLDDVTFRFQDDYLDVMCPNLEGMAWHRGMTYNGGNGIMGLHAEEGLLHFGHLMVDVKFSFPQGGDVSLTERLVNVVQELSSKVWIIPKSRTTVELVKQLNDMLFDVSGELSYADELLVSREFFLDPRVFEKKEDWQVITQSTGEMIVGDSPHCMMGCGFFSVASNFAMKRSFLSYIGVEEKLASLVRAAGVSYHEARKRINNGVAVEVRKFVFTSALITYFLTTCLKLSRYPPFCLGSLRVLYKDDKGQHKRLSGSNFPILFDDHEVIGEDGHTRQCHKCGAGFVIGMYVKGDDKVCVDCVLSEKKRKKYSFVSLFNGLLAKMTRLTE